MSPLRVAVEFALGFLLAAPIPLTGATSTQSPVRSKPNILLVVADDLGLQLGCYGDPVARTPSIDRFAAESTRFATAYVTQSSCSPSRSSLLTGLYPHQNGQIGLANRGYSMRGHIMTLPAMLQKTGYRTGIIGKLHVEPEPAFPFDYAQKNPSESRDVRLVAERATAFWKASAESSWFLMVNFFDPHVPFISQHKGFPAVPQTAAEVRAFDFQRIDTVQQREHIAGYYNGVARLDAGFNLLLQALDATGEAENTLVVFIGDNGPPFVRAKTNGTEAGLRVPLIVRWPLAPAKGVVSEALVSGADLVPTFLELAGLSSADLPGRTILDLLGRPKAGGNEYIFAEHNAHRRDMYFPQRIVRDARFKLVVNLADRRGFGVEVDGDPAHAILHDPAWHDTPAQIALRLLAAPPPEELYDLESDPNEFANLVERPEFWETLIRLREALSKWREATQDPLLDPTRRSKELWEHTSAGE